MKKSFREVDLLAQVLYEVVERRRSLDATFKNVCRRMRVGSLEEREELYAKCRKLVSDYVKLRCVAGRGRLSYRRLARMWLAGVGELPAEPYCRLSVSRWLYDRLVNLLSAGEVEELLRSFEERLLWLRLNWLRAPEERVLRELETEGLEFEVHPKIPYMVRVLRSPKPLRFLRSVKEFRVIPQDLASAVCVEFMDLGPGDVVVDMCAAPGLKTSLIAMLEDSAKVMAFDVSAERVRRMKYLLRKAGVQDHRVQLIVADSRWVNLFHRVDRVLLDAPCSNSGSIGKNPAIKATLEAGDVASYSKQQLELLLKSVELSESIVYSTCSLLPEEGEEVVERALGVASLGVSIPPRFRGFCRSGYPQYGVSGSVCRLFPHTHSSEGFFIAKLEVK